MNSRNTIPILLAATFSLTTVTFAQTDSGAPATATPMAEPAPAAPPGALPPAASDDTTAPATPAARPDTYTVVSGDSLWRIARKFDTTVKALMALNNLTSNNLKIGKVLKIPPLSPAEAGKAATPAAPDSSVPVAPPVHSTTTPDTKPSASIPAYKSVGSQKVYAKAQPVQSFDLTAPIEEAPPASVTVVSQHTEPVQQIADVAPVVPMVKPVTPVVVATPKEVTAPSNDSDTVTTDYAAAVASTSSTPANHITFAPNPLVTTPESDWQFRFVKEARALANRGIEYDEEWRPPGESSTWSMDCSNTSRYLYKVTAGIELPRTASDQYCSLQQQDKAWNVPLASNGYADTEYLRDHLKPGDLLFWENTYKPDRQPPVTHVMIFLGTNAKGQWIMAGSQSSRGGEYNSSNSGPDIYVFNPTQPCGGYSTWLGLSHHTGRFCAYGRPLEADPAKLAVVAND